MNNCDACVNRIKHNHGHRPRLFSFGLDYGHSVEEIDIMASEYRMAQKMCRAVARDYESGWRLIDLPPGGSGGLIEVWR